MKTAIKTTDTIERIGTRRRPQFHEPVATASPDPVINPSPLRVSELGVTGKTDIIIDEIYPPITVVK